jgi:hypothetical protein
MTLSDARTSLGAPVLHTPGDAPPVHGEIVATSRWGVLVRFAAGQAAEVVDAGELTIEVLDVSTNA